MLSHGKERGKRESAVPVLGSGEDVWGILRSLHRLHSTAGVRCKVSCFILLLSLFLWLLFCKRIIAASAVVADDDVAAAVTASELKATSLKLIFCEKCACKNIFLILLYSVLYFPSYVFHRSC